ncbi:uncharacterized protein [Pempheris klunzingeri]|uniref:uncharacterized protein n=1 Tax=Pempheris klunzingeri TaxID=3127111 RepID=UPI00397E9A48
MANQRRLFTLSLTWILFFSPWPISGQMHFSHLGTKCSGDCQVHGTEYQCTVLKTDGKEALQYCSPKKDVDYRGYECIDCCQKHGYGYYWCQTASNWGYCGDVVEDSVHYASEYDVPCYDGCDKRGSGYNWCHTNMGWDYCSTRKNVASKGQVCHSDYPCDKSGQKYFWCYLEGGGWDYCGRVEPKAMIHQTYELKECIDECQYDKSKEYFWCHTQNGWDYCSPLPDVTYKGEDCRPDHKCETHGYSYNWCFTKDSYGYCGVILPGECRYSEPRRSKRQPNRKPNARQVICTKEDNNQRRVTTFTAEDAQQHILEPNNRLRNEALDLINQWDNQGLGNQGRSNLITSDNLRIDLQGLINRNNQQYYNLQIQWNVPRRSGQSTTLAQIIVPVDTSAEYMREAFRESLQRRARIVLEVTETTMPGRNVCRRRN